MNSKTLAKIALIGALLIGGSAAQAADNQADWTVTLNVKLALLEDRLTASFAHFDIEQQNYPVPKSASCCSSSTTASSTDGTTRACPPCVPCAAAATRRPRSETSATSSAWPRRTAATRSRCSSGSCATS